ncbi:TonB-dependent receptor YncD [Salmonella enterica subsp. enterica]|uniref:TonB-dependent receptor YncD n=1 Tax=Salmonella enterica I TaxID=59201 RepID=A0A447PJ21_SALET|nr:TonB-dependent receptor YncD [Salmonella enterica subsp. enterica]
MLPVADLKLPLSMSFLIAADGQSGFNFDLKPSTNDTVEVGSKTRIGNGLLTAALFQTDTDDEIVVASSMGGRTTYKNAGKTRRQGAELALDQRFAGDWRVKASWTWLDATYRSNVCQGQNCDGNRMPGIARNMGFASLGFIPDEGWLRRNRRSLYGRYHGQ